jgi:hypothetical protein
MADEQLVTLLQEIRELQREHLTHYKVALQNQRESMAIQKRAVERSKIAFVALAVLFLFLGVTYFVPILSWALSSALRR